MSSWDLSCIDVGHFLEALGVDNISKATANEMRFSCPYPAHADGDRSPSCYMNVNTTAFFCHGCKAKGNAIRFAADTLSITQLEASSLLRQAYQPGGMDPDAIDMVAEAKKILYPREEVIVQPQLGEALLDRFRVDWSEVWCEWTQTHDKRLGYLFERGFEPETLMDWQFGFDHESRRVTIPVRDVDGTLIGFKARAIDDTKPKYLVLGDSDGKGRYGFPRYYPSRVVFGAHLITERVPNLTIHEGELNAIAFWQKISEPTVAINGSFFTEYHARVITRLADSVTLFLDSDEAGSNAVWGWNDSQGEHHDGIIETLAPFIDVYLVPEHEGDAADLDPEAIRNLLGSAKSALEVVLGLD